MLRRPRPSSLADPYIATFAPAPNPKGLTQLDPPLRTMPLKQMLAQIRGSQTNGSADMDLCYHWSAGLDLPMRAPTLCGMPLLGAQDEEAWKFATQR